MRRKLTIIWFNQLGRDYDFTNQMWKFDILGNAKMREMAVKDAEEADLIIISTHGTENCPRKSNHGLINGGS